MKDLSPRQSEILDFITSAIQQRGVAPTYREMGAALGIGSTNGVADHIKALIKKGYLERAARPGAPRALVPTSFAVSNIQENAVVSIPVVGRVAAGLPLLAEENYEGSVQVDASMMPPGGNVFGLVVTGDSMIEDGIHDGDYLFVRQKKTVRDGEIAVVMVDGEATVKRFYREGERIRLQPANSQMAPIYVQESDGECQVVGSAVAVFRRI